MKPCIQLIKPTDKHAGDSKKRKHTIKIEMKNRNENGNGNDKSKSKSKREREITLVAKPTRHFIRANRNL